MQNIQSKKGICRACGCTVTNPCHNPKFGFCWWADLEHTICSHCSDEEIRNDSLTVHCVNDHPEWDPDEGARKSFRLFAELDELFRRDDEMTASLNMIRELRKMETKR